VTHPDTPDVAIVLRVLQGTGKALTAIDIKHSLQAQGLPKEEAGKLWAAIQKRIKAHPHVVVEGKTYRWVSALDALELLMKGGLPEPKQSAFIDAIRAALQEDDATDPESAARERQGRIDAVRLLAELASEVEELLANETEPAVMIRQVRAWVRRSGLDPVGRAGEQTTFDRKVHKPIGGAIREGASVFVVRPGYVWKAADQDVLLGKAVVEE
jgi:hypothetical protein